MLLLVLLVVGVVVDVVGAVDVVGINFCFCQILKGQVIADVIPEST